MFNLGFTELLVLAVIGLLVLGPEQLPIVARKVARMINTIKHSMDDAMSPVNDFKQQAQQQLNQVEDEVNDSIEKAGKEDHDGSKS